MVFRGRFRRGLDDEHAVLDCEILYRRVQRRTLANIATIDDKNTDFFVNVGILVRPVENLSIGLTYKKRPSFSLQQTYRFTNFPSDSTKTGPINFNIPSSYGIGISYRPTDVLTFAVDVVRVNYSSLTKNFAITLSPSYVAPADFAVDDGMEYHGGAEYVLFLKTIGIVFRGGGYLEPDNRIRWVGDVNDSADPVRIFNRKTCRIPVQEREFVRPRDVRRGMHTLEQRPVRYGRRSFVGQQHGRGLTRDQVLTCAHT